MTTTHPREFLEVALIQFGILLGVVIIGHLLLFGFPQGPVTMSPPIVVLVISLVMVICLYPPLRNFVHESDPLEPVVIMAGLFFLYYPLNAIGLSLLGFSGAFPFTLRESDHLLAPLLFSLVLIGLAIVAFYVGYYTISKNRDRSLLPPIGNRNLLLSNLVIVWIISAGLYLLQALGVLSGGNAFISILATWNLYVPPALLARFYQNPDDRSTILVAIFVLAELLLITGLTFQLNDLLIQIVLLLLVYHYLGPSITYRKFAVVVGMIPLLFPISEIAERIQAGYPLQEAFLLKGAVVTDYVNTFVIRMIGTEALTAVVAQTPEQVPFQYGETILLTVYSFVPRIVWPDKPSIIMCGLNNLHFSGRGPDANTCSAMTVAGELYWNFGAPGVMIGLLIFGAGVGILYRWLNDEFRAAGPRYVSILLYAVVLTHAIRFESGIAQMISSMVKQLVFAGLFLFFVSERTGKRTFQFSHDTALERSKAYQFGVSVRERFAELAGESDTIHLASAGIQSLTTARSRFPDAVAHSQLLPRVETRLQRADQTITGTLRRSIFGRTRRALIAAAKFSSTRQVLSRAVHRFRELTG